MNPNKMTTNDDDDAIESSLALALVVEEEEAGIPVVGPTIASTTTDMAADDASTTTTSKLHTMDVVTDSTATTDPGTGTVVVVVSSVHENGSGCPCTGCGTLWTSEEDDTASSGMMMNLCPLVRDGCRACLAVYQAYYYSDCDGQRGSCRVNTAPPRRSCLFRTCSLRNSRIVKDDIVLELDRILSATAAATQKQSVARGPWNDRLASPPPPQDVLPVGTIVLCCWYLNGVRIYIYNI